MKALNFLILVFILFAGQVLAGNPCPSCSGAPADLVCPAVPDGPLVTLQPAGPGQIKVVIHPAMAKATGNASAQHFLAYGEHRGERTFHGNGWGKTPVPLSVENGFLTAVIPADTLGEGGYFRGSIYRELPGGKRAWSDLGCLDQHSQVLIREEGQAGCGKWSAAIQTTTSGPVASK